MNCDRSTRKELQSTDHQIGTELTASQQSSSQSSITRVQHNEAAELDAQLMILKVNSLFYWSFSSLLLTSQC